MSVNILHLHSSFSPGGKELRAVRLMNAFGAAARHTIVSGVPDALGAEAMIAPGIAYQIAQNPPPLTGRPSVARYEAIARFMRKFDLVLSYNWGAIDGVMARRVYTRGTPPIVHHEDGFNEDEANGLSSVRNMYRRFALAAAHALVVPSHHLREVARTAWKQPDARVHRISNGIPVDAFATIPADDAIPGFRRMPGAAVVGTVAGLRPVKDIPMLVRAVAGVNRRVQLVIVGDGPARGEVEAAVARMGLEDRVLLAGHLPHPERYMGLFDIFAISSKSEQQPIAVMEAMAAGLAITGTPVGDIMEMVAEPNRPYISPDRNEVHLRDRIDVMAASLEGCKALGSANRERAREKFDEATMIAAYAKLYADAIGRPGAFDKS